LIINRLEDKCTTASEAAFSFGLGAIGGTLGGPTSASKAFSETSSYIEPGLAKASNQAMSAGLVSSFAVV
jgi:hypothetical protein